MERVQGLKKEELKGVKLKYADKKRDKILK